MARAAALAVAVMAAVGRAAAAEAAGAWAENSAEGMARGVLVRAEVEGWAREMVAAAMVAADMATETGAVETSAARSAGTWASPASSCNNGRRSSWRDRNQFASPPVTPLQGRNEPWVLLLRDGVELSEAFYVFTRYFLASQTAKNSVMGLALGTPAGANGEVPQDGDAQVVLQGKPGTLQFPSSCATVYSASAWLELREYALERLRLDEDAACNAAAEVGWNSLQRQFMLERGYWMHFSGLNLCRSQGEASLQLASGDKVAQFLTQPAGRRWV